MDLRRVGIAACAVLGLTGLAAPPATASPHPDWQRYVEAPASADVHPARVVSTAGSVSGANALVTGHGTATLSMTAGGAAPTILLDYGEDVGGVPYFAVTAASGLPTLRAGYSEAQQYASPTGDEAQTTFLPRPGEDPLRHDDFPVTGAGVLKTGLIEGGERFEELTLTTPGSVTLSAVGVNFLAYRATPDKYQGWFLSSDDQLNRIWYAGAYTTQLDMVPANTPDGGAQPVIYDGAKRDRLIWVGDLYQAGPTILDSLGGNGSDYVRQSLAVLGANQTAAGSVPGASGPSGVPNFVYSTSYSIYYVVDVAQFYQYTGDLAFARQEWPIIQRELAWNATNVNSAGLLTTNTTDGNDWDYYDGNKTGAVTEYNALYYHALTSAAALAKALGHPDAAAQYQKQAAVVKTAINTNLYDPATGVYDISDAKRGPIAQDANIAVIDYGVAPADRVAPILATLKQKLWNANGSEPFTADANYDPRISPYVSGFDVQTRFAAGDTEDALALLRAEWGPMVRSGPQYTGAFWENVQPDGSLHDGSQSLAHGWSSGPTSALTSYVLGVTPSGPGYRTWHVAPQPGDLAWARGQVPTGYGPIGVSWQRGAWGFALTVTAPGGTSGTITVPGSVVLVDGRPVAGSTVPVGPGTHVVTVLR